jgi:hypothetical protein
MFFPAVCFLSRRVFWHFPPLTLTEAFLTKKIAPGLILARFYCLPVVLILPGQDCRGGAAFPRDGVGKSVVMRIGMRRVVDLGKFDDVPVAQRNVLPAESVTVAKRPFALAVAGVEIAADGFRRPPAIMAAELDRARRGGDGRIDGGNHRVS